MLPLILLAFSVVALGIFIRILVSSHDDPKDQSIAMTLWLKPDEEQEFNTYIERGDMVDVTWTSSKADVAYHYRVEDGHGSPGVFGVGLSDKGAERFKSTHGGLYTVWFKNVARRPVTVTIKAIGHFESFSPRIKKTSDRQVAEHQSSSTARRLK